MDTSSKRETLAAFVFGGFASGKSTFINSVCDEFGSVILQQTSPSTLGCIGCGLYQLDAATNLVLYDMQRNFLDIIGIAGKWIGVIVIVNSQQPETFRDANGLISTFRAYLPLPLIVVDNPHRKDPATKQYEYVSDDGSMSDAELRLALQLDNDTQIVKCDVSNPTAAKAIVHDLIQSKTRQTESLTLPPETHIRYEQEVFTPDRSHRFLVVVGTEGWYGANYVMELVADQVTWVTLDERKIPRRWGYIELDSVHLHIIPVEHFGNPVNNVSVALDNILALVEGKRPPLPEIEGELILTEGTIGCVGIFNSHDEWSVARTKHMVKAFGDYPYVLVDTGRGRVGQSSTFVESVDEASLGSRHPIMRVEKLDKEFPKEAICLLARQLTGTEGEKLRTKFACL